MSVDGNLMVAKVTFEHIHNLVNHEGKIVKFTYVTNLSSLLKD